ncbi:mitochondrial nicotinamide adenine dinucleotide transporter 1 [Monosporozyma servazzii]
MAHDEPVNEVTTTRTSKNNVNNTYTTTEDPKKRLYHEQAEFLFPDSMAPLSSMNVVETQRDDAGVGYISEYERPLNYSASKLDSDKSHTKSSLVVANQMTEDTIIPKNKSDLESISPLPKSNTLSVLTETKRIAISGALAGFLSGIVVCPLDVTKTRLQAQGLNGAENPYYKGIIGTMNTILKDEGVRGLYKGLVPILLGYFPTWTIYFSVYEFSKRHYPQWFPHSDFISHSCSAITAGIASTTVTNPIWVVKTRLMLQSDRGPYSTQYKGTIDAFRSIWNQEGMRTFYNGLVPSLLGLFHVAIHFPVYEKLKVRFNCYSLKENDPTHSYELRLPNLIMASSVSKMVASSLTYPHEILRTRMQLRPTTKSINLPVEVQKKIIPLIKATYRNEGMRGFYSGFTANLLRTVPASAITLVSFEYVRNKLSILNI